MKKIRVYLSGSIQKGSDDATKKSVWTGEDISVLREAMGDAIDLLLLNPASRSDDLSDYKSVFGRDLLQVYISDLVLVDARDRKGIGIGAEMLFAKSFGIPVISVVPPNSQYHKEHLDYLGQSINNWIHPFIGGLSDHIAESVYDAAVYIKDHCPFDRHMVKDMDDLFLMIRHYIDTQYERDLEMYHMTKQDRELLDRIEQIKSQEA